MDKKADVNQVFVYVFSTIIIGFAAFLVIQFIAAFTEDAGTQTNTIFFENIEYVYSEVARNWGSEEFQEFRVTNNIEYVCFAQNSCDTNQLPVDNATMDTFIEGNDNVVLFTSQTNPELSGRIGEFEIENQCQCIEPIDGRLELFFKNNRNEITIENFD